MSIISKFPGGDGGVSPTLITRSITENGTYNASGDNADGYSQVTVNVSGGGGNQYAMNIDFTKYPSGVTVFSNVSISSAGAVFNTTGKYFRLPLSGAITIEIDVASMSLTSGTHRRFVMGDTSCGLIYRSNGKWSFYGSGSAWATDSDITDGSYFNGHTAKIVIDSSGYWHIYKDNTLMYEPDKPYSLVDSLYIGASSNSINAVTISAIRVY